jgi:sulfate permease, SulP family
MSSQPKFQSADIPAIEPARANPSPWRLPFGQTYSADELRRDLLAALTVAAISLPQAMAYALLAGVDPRFGLYSAIVITAVAAIFGSSSHLINGPTSAISLVVFGALAFFDPDQRIEAAEAMFLLAVMVGTVQILIAVFKLGDLTRYISESVVLGFMTAAATLLAVGQVGNALGVRDRGTGLQHVLYRLWLTLTHGDPVNPKAVTITVATLALAVLARRVVQRYRLPRMDMLLVLIIVAWAAYLAGWTIPGNNGKTLIAVAGAVPSSLPTLHIPSIKLNWMVQLSPDALAIAFLGLLEALAIAKSIANQTGQVLDFNRQCLAEGIANLVGGFFRCLPGSGSLSRSAINFQSGGATRFVGIITAAAVALAVVALAPLARFVPKPALAALLLLTATRLIDLPRLGYTIRASREDAVVLAITVVAGIGFGLDASILVGAALSIVLYVSRAAKLRLTELVVDRNGVIREKVATDPPAESFALYDLEGELFFGAAPALERCLTLIQQQVQTAQLRYLVLRLKRVRNIDAVCLERLDHFLRTFSTSGVTVLLAGLRPDLLQALARLRLLEWLPQERIFPQGHGEDSATVGAIRAVYSQLGASPANTAVKPLPLTDSAQRQLYYLP